LTLAPVNSSTVNPSFDICVHDGDGVKWLSVKAKPSDLVSYRFAGKSKNEKYVESIYENNNYIFKDVPRKREFEWMGELKTGKAQRIASALSARIHTLGVDEFEWMRLHQKQ
jgi:hypothetical protein